MNREAQGRFRLAVLSQRETRHSVSPLHPMTMKNDDDVTSHSSTAGEVNEKD